MPDVYQTRSSCGYCKGKTCSLGLGFDAPDEFDVGIYQQMINQGWRRSGNWIYRPDGRKTCCPHYTIRLNVLNFTASKTQRKQLRRFNRVMQLTASDAAEIHRTAPLRARQPPENLLYEIFGGLGDDAASSNARLKVTIEPSTFDDEKHALYFKYQTSIHMEASDKITEQGFKSFLCDSPLQVCARRLSSP